MVAAREKVHYANGVERPTSSAIEGRALSRLDPLPVWSPQSPPPRAGES